MDMTTPPQLGLGAWLLDQARDHGLTSNELADILGLPCHHIRQLTAVADLDDLPVRSIRALAQALDLPWPGWLSPPASARSHHPPPDHRSSSADTGMHPSDADQIQAVLALLLGRPLHLGQLAYILHWSAERVQRAIAQLAPLIYSGHGLRLLLDGNNAKLTVTPNVISRAARARLHQVTLQQQGPPPGIAYIAYRLANHNDQDSLDLARRQPELLAAAVAAGYLTHQTDDDGHPFDVQLTSDVAFSLGITGSPRGPRPRHARSGEQPS